MRMRMLGVQRTMRSSLSKARILPLDPLIHSSDRGRVRSTAAVCNRSFTYSEVIARWRFDGTRAPPRRPGRPRRASGSQRRETVLAWVFVATLWQSRRIHVRSFRAIK